MDAHCVDCGLPVSLDRIDSNDGKARCLGCKKKSLGADEPREFTKNEVRERVLRHIWSMIGWWLSEERAPEPLDKLEGLAHSMLAMLDGSAAALPGFIVAPVGHPEDEEFHRDRLENWFPHNGKAIEKAVKCDIAGGLHEVFHKLRPETLPKSGPIKENHFLRPPTPQTPLETFGMVAMYQVLDHLKKTAGEFSTLAWKSIQDYVAQTKGKFHSALFGDVKVMVVVLLEMMTVTFAQNGKMMSLIGPVRTLNHLDQCGIHAIFASAEEARAMVATVLGQWDAARLAPDEELLAAWKMKKDSEDQLYQKP